MHHEDPAGVEAFLAGVDSLIGARVAVLVVVLCTNRPTRSTRPSCPAPPPRSPSTGPTTSSATRSCATPCTASISRRRGLDRSTGPQRVPAHRPRHDRERRHHPEPARHLLGRRPSRTTGILPRTAPDAPGPPWTTTERPVPNSRATYERPKSTVDRREARFSRSTGCAGARSRQAQRLKVCCSTIELAARG